MALTQFLGSSAVAIYSNKRRWYSVAVLIWHGFCRQIDVCKGWGTTQSSALLLILRTSVSNVRAQSGDWRKVTRKRAWDAGPSVPPALQDSMEKCLMGFKSLVEDEDKWITSL